MAETKLPEVWLRGPIEGISAQLQPVAHALLQARDEVNQLMEGLDEAKLRERPGSVASPAFHLQHIPGVLDRLFTYAQGQQLSPDQLDYLSNEGKQGENIKLSQLLSGFNQKIEQSVETLKAIDPQSLTDFRGVGRKQLPSTVLGLIFHSAEHTMRHLGQLLVAVKVLKNT